MQGEGELSEEVKTPVTHVVHFIVRHTCDKMKPSRNLLEWQEIWKVCQSLESKVSSFNLLTF